MDFELLNEGGAAGHMNHLYDNGELTFAKMKEIFTAAANGQLIGTEKTDGQNLMISFSVHDGRAKGVRNKGEIKAGGLNPEELAMKFADRANPALKETFADALRIFEKAVQGLDHETQIKLFGPDTNIYYNAEVMDPRTPNVINYDTKTLVIHRAGHAEFDRATGDRKDIDVSEQAKELEDIIRTAQERLKGEEYGIQVNAVRRLQALTDKKPLEDAIASLDKLLSSVNYLGPDNKLTEDSTINEFMLGRINNIINNILAREKSSIGDVSALARMAIAKRILEIPGATVIAAEKHLTPQQKIVVKEKILNKVAIGNILKTAIAPLENIVSEFATEMLRDLRSAFILDNSKEVARLKSEVQIAINAIKASGNVEAMDILKRQLQKLKSADRVSATAEGFVFDYDGVTYKFTGSFAPINQLLGLFKYGRGKVPPIKKQLNEEVDEPSDEQGSVIPIEPEIPTDDEQAIQPEEDVESKEKDIICIYPGRFQPMCKHHLETYKYLQRKFGADNVYIATSDVVNLPKSPLTFEEKQKIFKKYQIQPTQYVKVRNPYKAVEITSKFIPSDTIVVYAVGKKDMEYDAKTNTAPRFTITPTSHFQRYEDTPRDQMKSYIDNEYIIVVPDVKTKVEITNNKTKQLKEINVGSGTQVRDILSRSEYYNELNFKEIMGFIDLELQKMLFEKFKYAKQFVKKPKPPSTAKVKARKVAITPNIAKPAPAIKPIKENSIDDIINEVLTETITKRGNKYCLISKKSKKNLGCYTSRSGAEKREKQVQYFKHLKEMSGMSAGAVAGFPANAKKEENN